MQQIASEDGEQRNLCSVFLGPRGKWLGPLGACVPSPSPLARTMCHVTFSLPGVGRSFVSLCHISVEPRPPSCPDEADDPPKVRPLFRSRARSPRPRHSLAGGLEPRRLQRGCGRCNLPACLFSHSWKEMKCDLGQGLRFPWRQAAGSAEREDAGEGAALRQVPARGHPWPHPCPITGSPFPGLPDVPGRRSVSSSLSGFQSGDLILGHGNHECFRCLPRPPWLCGPCDLCFSVVPTQRTSPDR